MEEYKLIYFSFLPRMVEFLIYEIISLSYNIMVNSCVFGTFGYSNSAVSPPPPAKFSRDKISFYQFPKVNGRCYKYRLYQKLLQMKVVQN